MLSVLQPYWQGGEVGNFCGGAMRGHHTWSQCCGRQHGAMGRHWPLRRRIALKPWTDCADESLLRQQQRRRRLEQYHHHPHHHHHYPHNDVAGCSAGRCPPPRKMIDAMIDDFSHLLRDDKAEKVATMAYEDPSPTCASASLRQPAREEDYHHHHQHQPHHQPHHHPHQHHHHHPHQHHRHHHHLHRDKTVEDPDRICWRIADDRESCGRVSDNALAVHGELELPRDVSLPMNLDDLNVELDESARTLTIRSTTRRSSECCRSTWEFSQRLDDSIDLSQLQAAVDPHEGRLLLSATLRPSLVQQQQQQPHLQQYSVPCSERNPVPFGGANATGETECVSRIDGATLSGPVSRVEETHSSTRTIPISQRPIEIEDIGPDEESDRISVSSNEAASI